MNLLQHKVFIAAFFGSVHIPVGSFKLFFYFFIMYIVNTCGILVKYSDLVVFKEVVVPCVFKYGRNVGSNKTFVIADAYNKRAFASYSKDGIGIIGKNNTQSVRALKFLCNTGNSCDRVAVVVKVKKLSHHFCIGIAFKASALGNKEVFQSFIVLDNAVVNDSNTFAAVRVGIDIGRFAMGSPAGVTLRLALDFHFIGEVSKSAF